MPRRRGKNSGGGSASGAPQQPVPPGSSDAAAGAVPQRKRGKRRGGGGSASGTAQQPVPPQSSGAAAGVVEHTDPLEDLFLQFFTRYKEDNDTVSFYKAELAAMELKHNPNPTLRVDYLHLMGYSPQLAYKLLSDTESTKGLIARAFKRYVPQESYLGSAELNVYCYNFPVFDRKEMLLEFLTSSPPVVPFKLHDGVYTPVCSPPGSSLFQGYVDYMLAHHQKGLTWNGDFQATDMIVLTVHGRYEVHILKEPSLGLDHDSMGNDFKCLADILLHHYTLSTSGVHNDPPFFKQLCTALRDIPENVPSNKKSMDRFIMFLANHMAFLPSMSRSNLIFNLMRVYKVMGPVDKQTFEQVVNQGQTNQLGTDWRTRAIMDNLFFQVYMGRPVSQARMNQMQYKVLGYGSSYGTKGMDLLKFQRNFVVHAVEYLKDTNQNPTISTLEELDYLLSYQYDKFLVDILKRLVDAFDMQSLLQQVWLDCTSPLAKTCTLTSDGEN